MPKKISIEPVLAIETYRIQAKYAPEVFFPANAVELRFWKDWFSRAETRFETLDGKICVPKFIATFNNQSGAYDDFFDDLCKRKFDMPFCNIRSVWISRLGDIDNWWHLVKLNVIE